MSTFWGSRSMLFQFTWVDHNTNPLGDLAHPSPTSSVACWDQFSFRGISLFLRIHKYRQRLPPPRCHVLWGISWVSLNWYHLRAISAAHSLCLRPYNLQIESFFIICVWHATPLVCQQCEARAHVDFVQQFILWSVRSDYVWQALNEMLFTSVNRVSASGPMTGMWASGGDSLDGFPESSC